jgi:hypothetical protein
METHALVLALALTLPLALYGVPYAYAATSTLTTYSVQQSNLVANGSDQLFNLRCLSPSDSSAAYPALSFPILRPDNPFIHVFLPLNSAGTQATDGQTVNGWKVDVTNTEGHAFNVIVIILCTTSITVAGIGVPEFGSLYVAIALGAVAYFMLSRRFARRPTISAQPQP